MPAAAQVTGPSDGLAFEQPFLAGADPVAPMSCSPVFHELSLKGRMLDALMGKAPGRHLGLGAPLTRESWLFRPYSASVHIGMFQGAELIEDWVGMKTGFYGGLRLGWDMGHYWGTEMSLAFATVPLYDSARAKQAQRQADIDAGYAPTDPWLDRFDGGRHLDLTQFNVRLMYYPWGDAAWRPYCSIGMGISEMRFTDRLSVHYQEYFVLMPIALGVKYRYNDWIALQLEAADNLSIGGSASVRTTNNFSLTAGIEFRFGGSRTAYWPWNPGRTYW